MSKINTRVYNPKLNGGYGGYMHHEERERRVQKSQRKLSNQEKVAKELLEQLILSVNRGNRWRARLLLKAAKSDPILRKNARFMRRVHGGLSVDDMGYLKALIKSM